MIGDPDIRRLRIATDFERNPSLEAAFDSFGLDPTKPNHRDLLLALLAETYFESSRGRGQPKRWGEDELCQLLADFGTVKRKYPNEKSERELCGRLRKDVRFKERYRPFSTEPIRKKLQHPRAPQYND